MSDIPLTVLKGGINRLRTKGGARADSLYDLLNAHLTDDGTVVVRPGTFRDYTVPSGTKGLTTFRGTLVTFAAEVVDVPEGVELRVLVHPEQDPGEAVIPLKRIHFAEPFMGSLYVVAEFEDDTVWHYWLQEGTDWEAETMYHVGDIVTPTTPNGLAYRATRVSAANPLWKAGTPRTVGDVVEPTDPNGFYYTVVNTEGATPTSGSVEPDWPESDGAQVTESTDLTSEAQGEDATDPTRTPGSDVTDRYGE